MELFTSTQFLYIFGKEINKRTEFYDNNNSNNSNIFFQVIEWASVWASKADVVHIKCRVYSTNLRPLKKYLCVHWKPDERKGMPPLYPSGSLFCYCCGFSVFLLYFPVVFKLFFELSAVSNSLLVDFFCIILFVYM